MMSLYQLYKQQEIITIKWIYKYHNPADFMTKSQPLSNLKMLINSNCINISTIEWVE